MAKLVKKVEKKMKSSFSDPKHTIYIVGLMATFDRACNITLIHEAAAILELLYFVKGKVADTLKSRLCVTDMSCSIALPVRNVENRSKKSCG